MDMTRADDGTWSITTGRLSRGFTNYWFLTDGVAMNDPASETYFGGASSAAAWRFLTRAQILCGEDVPHAMYAFAGISRRRPRRGGAYVYTPPRVTTATRGRATRPVPSTRRRRNERAGPTRAARTSSSTTASRGPSKPMIVVMEQGYRHGARGGAGAYNAGRGTGQPSLFEQVVVNDLIPWSMPPTDHFRQRPSRPWRGVYGGGRRSRSPWPTWTSSLDRRVQLSSARGAGSKTPTRSLRRPGGVQQKVHLLCSARGSAEERMLSRRWPCTTNWRRPASRTRFTIAARPRVADLAPGSARVFTVLLSERSRFEAADALRRLSYEVRHHAVLILASLSRQPCGIRPTAFRWKAASEYLSNPLGSTSKAAAEVDDGA